MTSPLLLSLSFKHRMHRHHHYHALPLSWLLLTLLVLLPPPAVVLAFFAHPPPIILPDRHTPSPPPPPQLQGKPHQTRLWSAAMTSTSGSTHDLPLLDDVRRMHPRELYQLLTENEEDKERLHAVGMMLTEEIARLRNQVWMEQLSRKVSISRGQAMTTKWQVKAAREETKALSNEIKMERLKSRVRLLEAANEDLADELGWIEGEGGEEEKGGGRGGRVEMYKEEEGEGDVDDLLGEEEDDDDDDEELDEEDHDPLFTEEEEEDEEEGEAWINLGPEMEGEEEVGAVARGVATQAEDLVLNMAEEEAVVDEEETADHEGAYYPGMEYTDPILANLERLARKLEE